MYLFQVEREVSQGDSGAAGGLGAAIVTLMLSSILTRYL